MYKEVEKYNWSEWRVFPDPRKGEILIAPYGFGIYQLRDVQSGEFILFGRGNNCAYRMSSLLPKPFGQGTRNNESKRLYLLENLSKIEYRTISLLNLDEMIKVETEVKELRIHKFNT